MIDILIKLRLAIVFYITEQVKFDPVLWSNFDLFFYCRSPPKDSFK